MQLIRDPGEMRAYTRNERKYDRSVGFVPTMGALHAGHQSLIARSAEENDATVVSVFVNPTQFMPGEDFEAYPRDEAGDLEKAEAAGADVVFAPAPETMYPGEQFASVYVARLSDPLCGMSRGRGHFRGVCTVVTKLFHIVEPDRAYFGQKDLQQALILDRMTTDLDMAVEIVICPIVRAEDGLALSSRNAYLRGDDRERALALRHALVEGRRMLREGERAGMVLREAMYEVVERTPGVRIDYLEIVDPSRLEEVEWIDDVVIFAGAVEVGDTRLIDNLIVHPEHGPWEG